MATLEEQVEAAIDAWVAEQIAKSPDWTPEQRARIWACLGGSEEPTSEREAA